MPNTKNNVQCWNCDHFQPFEEGSEPATSFGECRWRPKGEDQSNIQELTSWWPFIGDGRIFWCSKWQVTTRSIPTEPAQPRAVDWPTDWENFHQGGAWNVKAAVGVSCWNCNNFQRDVANPTQPGENTGECRKYPVPDVMDLVVGVTSDTLRGNKIALQGSLYWCDCFEPATGTVPVDPGP